MKLSLALAVVGTLAGAAPASATLYVATYSGLIIGGVDGAGLFGPLGGQLGGDVVTARYVYDTALGIRSTNPYVSDTLYGGTSQNVSSPIVSAMLTVNGIRIAGPAGDNDSHTNYIREYMPFDYSTAYVLDNVQDNAGGYLYNEVRSEVIPSSVPPSIETPFTMTGHFQGGGYLIRGAAVTNFAFGYDGTVTVAETSVPEPTTWAMMLLGLAAVGLARRTLRGQPASAS